MARGRRRHPGLAVTALPLPGARPAEPLQAEIARQAGSAARLPGDLMAPLRASDPELPLETRSVRATPCRTLIAATSDAQLVVIAAHRRRAQPGLRTHTGPHARPALHLGPAAQALLHHAHCPVAIVPVP